MLLLSEQWGEDLQSLLVVDLHNQAALPAGVLQKGWIVPTQQERLDESHLKGLLCYDGSSSGMSANGGPSTDDTNSGSTGNDCTHGGSRAGTTCIISALPKPTFLSHISFTIHLGHQQA